MRTRICTSAATAAVLLSSCSDRPRSIVGPERSGAEMSAAAAPPVCTVSWRKAVAGKWEDPGAWDRGRVPTNADVVCIDRPGQYFVTVLQGVASTVYVGDGSSGVELIVGRQRGTFSLDASAVVVRRQASLRTLTGAKFRTGTLDGEGTLRIDGGALEIDELVLRDGSLLFANVDVSVSGLERLTSGGDIYLNDSLTLELLHGAEASFDSTGLVSGVNGLLTIATLPGARAEVIWNGGQLYTSPATDRALVVARGVDVNLAATRYGSLTIDPDGDSIEVRGVVGSQATITIEKTRLSGATDVNLRSVRNRGRMQLTSTSGDPMNVAGSLVNEGDLALGGGEIQLHTDSLHNANELTVADSTRLTRGILRNRGTVHVTGPASDFVIAGAASFLADSGGVVTGTVVAEAGGIVGGSGALSRVIANGGLISPGDPRQQLGSLTIDTLILDPASRTILDLYGVYGIAGDHDRIHVTEHLGLSGTLETRLLVYYRGGNCGDILQAITSDPSAVQVGSFQSAPGLSIDSVSAYLVHLAPHAVELIGYDPTSRLSFADTELRTSERTESSDSTLACLSGPGPSADVTATGVSPLGQSTILDSLQFTPTDWMYPKPIAVRAVNDTLVELKSHVDSIRFDLTSTDAAYSGSASHRLMNIISDDDLGPDLEVAHVGGPVVVSLNQQFEGAFEVTNLGPGNSSGATFAFAWLQGLDYVSHGAGVSCISYQSIVVCTVDPIPEGGTVRFTMLFRATTVGVHANAADLSGFELDPNPFDGLVYTVTVN